MLTPQSLQWPPIRVFSSLEHTLKYRVLFDVREFNWYLEEGSWFRQGFLPYIDHPYEYPVLATALFTFVAAVSEEVMIQHFVFRALVIAMGAVLLAVTIRDLHRVSRTGLAWLLLAPSVLYFTINRFDVVPALLLQISLIALLRLRWRWAFVLLVIAILVKWYAGLLFPFYLMFLFDHARTPAMRREGFVAMVMGIALLLLGHVWVLFAGGDLLDATNPYAIHFVRAPEIGSLVAAALVPFGHTFVTTYSLEQGVVDVPIAVGVGLSTLLQFSGLVFALWAYFVCSRQTRNLPPTFLYRLAFIVIGCFVLFNRVYSYQWIVWLAPLFIMTLPSRRSVYLFFTHDVVNYIQFPILYGTFISPTSFTVFVALTFLRSALLAWLIVRSGRELLKEIPHVPSPPIVVGTPMSPHLHT